MDGLPVIGRFPTGHKWEINILIKAKPDSADRREHLMAVVFEGKCSCGGKLFFGLPAPKCWGFTSSVPHIQSGFMRDCLLEIYNKHFNSEKPLIYA